MGHDTYYTKLIHNILKTVMVTATGLLGLYACNPPVERIPPSPRSFKTMELLISLSDMPPNWFVGSGPVKNQGDTLYYSRDASYVVFETDSEYSPKGASHDIYQFIDSANAEHIYNDFFVGMAGKEPPEWSYQSGVADQYYFVCYDYEGRFPPFCSWVGRYEEFIVVFRAWLIPDRMTLSDIEQIVKTIDSIMGEKLK